jgi:FkbM family methyltransferase
MRAAIPLARAVVRHAPSARLRAAAWAAARRAGLHDRPHAFTARTRDGSRIAGDQARIMPRCLYWFGLWEPLVTAWLREVLRPGDTFVDVGANVGVFSLLASRAVGPDGRVVAVEPSAGTRAQLEANLARNRTRNVRVVASAAGAQVGDIPFYRAPWNDAESSTVGRPELELEATVGVAPLLDLLTSEELERLRAIKIDVEGGEAEVLEGIRSQAGRLPERLDIVVEVHSDVLARNGTAVHDLIAPFADLGFRPAWLPVDISEEAHLHAPGRAVPRTTGMPAGAGLVHVVLSRGSAARSPGDPSPDGRGA